MKRLIFIILFILIFRIFLNFFFSIFKIPSISMEDTLLKGDYILVNKIKFIHNVLETLTIPSFIDNFTEKAPSHEDYSHNMLNFFNGRLSAVKRNSIIVFSDLLKNIDDVSANSFLVKRCIGIPGDKIEIKNANFFVNGILENTIFQAKEEFIIFSNIHLNTLFFKINNIEEFTENYKFYVNHRYNKNQYVYVLRTTKRKIQQLYSDKLIKNFSKVYAEKDYQDLSVYPNSMTYNWNRDNFGPVTVPKVGYTIRIDKKSIALYGNLITNYDIDNYKKFKIIDTCLYYKNKKMNTYTFKKNYYFFVGDNRHSSIDSRFFGFVPQENLVGFVEAILFSIDIDNESVFKKIRWKRLFSSVQ